MNFYISDPHFGHANIIKYCSRPFLNVQSMDAWMIERWNAKVSPSDTVYCLGDFCFNAEVFMDIVPRLNGHIRFIAGNHDERILRRQEIKRYIQQEGRLFLYQKDIIQVVIGDNKIILCHYPMYSWNCGFHGAYHFYGHVHNQGPQQFAYPFQAFNVSVEMIDYEPEDI